MPACIISVTLSLPASAGEMRNDLYVSLEKGEFEKGGKSVARNVEVTVYVLDVDGQVLKVGLPRRPLHSPPFPAHTPLSPPPSPSRATWPPAPGNRARTSTTHWCCTTTTAPAGPSRSSCPSRWTCSEARTCALSSDTVPVSVWIQRLRPGRGSGPISELPKQNDSFLQNTAGN